MIRDLHVSVDQGPFPIVSWKEWRGIHAPESWSMATIECRIVKDKKKGELLFARRGTNRDGAYEEAKSWAELTGFGRETATVLYHSERERAWHKLLNGKSRFGELLTNDHDKVIYANFGISVRPIHLNCTDASTVEFENVQLLLKKLFVDGRAALLTKYKDKVSIEDNGRGSRSIYWPEDDPGVLDYDEDSKPNNAAAPSLIIDVLSWVIVLAIFAALFGGIWYLIF